MTDPANWMGHILELIRSAKVDSELETVWRNLAFQARICRLAEEDRADVREAYENRKAELRRERRG